MIFASQVFLTILHITTLLAIYDQIMFAAIAHWQRGGSPLDQQACDAKCCEINAQNEVWCAINCNFEPSSRSELIDSFK